jgi:anthranilate/para-aminobenzoate synthase component II
MSSSSVRGSDEFRGLKVLLVDNYDSFTYNLYQYMCELGATVDVVRNDVVTVQQCLDYHPDRVLLSPGPGTPSDAGVTSSCIEAFASIGVPVFGVCLVRLFLPETPYRLCSRLLNIAPPPCPALLPQGMQCMFEHFGGVIEGAGEIKHGKASPMVHDGKGAFHGLPDRFLVLLTNAAEHRRARQSRDSASQGTRRSSA